MQECVVWFLTQSAMVQRLALLDEVSHTKAIETAVL